MAVLRVIPELARNEAKAVDALHQHIQELKPASIAKSESSVGSVNLSVGCRQVGVF